LYKQAMAWVRQLPLLVSLLRGSYVAHFLLQFFGEFRVFDANSLYRRRRRDELFDQVFAKFRVFEIRIRLKKRLLFHDKFYHT
jgi:hypothetical protein